MADVDDETRIMCHSCAKYLGSNIIRTGVELARQGDTQSAQLYLSRAWPAVEHDDTLHRQGCRSWTKILTVHRKPLDEITRRLPIWAERAKNK